MAANHRTALECAIIGGTSGLFAAGVNIAARYTTDAGDILGFIGGAVGAGAAVIGAKWLEDSKTRTNDRESITQIEESLINIWKRGDSLSKANDTDIVAKLLSAKQALDLFVAIQRRINIKDINIAAIVEALVHWEPTILSWINRELNYSENGNNVSSRIKAVHLIGEALKLQVKLAFQQGTGWTGAGKAIIR